MLTFTLAPNQNLKNSSEPNPTSKLITNPTYKNVRNKRLKWLMNNYISKL